MFQEADRFERPAQIGVMLGGASKIGEGEQLAQPVGGHWFDVFRPFPPQQRQGSLWRYKPVFAAVAQAEQQPLQVRPQVNKL